MKKMLFASIAILTALVAQGCGGPKAPADMPKLFPTTITITQEGAPCEDAIVQLVKPEEPTYKWLIGGRTDAQGKCEIKTQGKYKGAPEGSFAVVVYKTVTLESETRKAQPSCPADPEEARIWSQKVHEEERVFEHVDTKYKKATTTDLKIDVVSGKNDQSFDVGPAIEEEVQKMGTTT